MDGETVVGETVDAETSAGAGAPVMSAPTVVSAPKVVATSSGHGGGPGAERTVGHRCAVGATTHGHATHHKGSDDNHGGAGRRSDIHHSFSTSLGAGAHVGRVIR